MVTSSPAFAATLADLTRLYKENRIEECRAALKQILFVQPDFFQKLLWIGQVSENPDEAIHAAELALALKPTDEIAQRVLLRVQERFPQQSGEAKIDVLRLTGMTVSQARSVKWPFRGLNRAIGLLFDEKIISIKDLAFAADSGYNAIIKKAATTLLLDYFLQGRTAQPPRPVAFLKGPNYANRQVKLNTLGAGVIFGFFLAFAIWIIVSAQFDLVDKTIGGLSLLAYVVLTPLVFRTMDKLTNQILSSERGRDAEMRCVDIFRASLQNPWIIVQNLVWPNRKWGDVDIVLAGPGGIWAFEVKAYSSRPIRNIGDRWEYKTRLGWFKMKKNPGMQARRNAVTLREYLNHHGVNIKWVQPVIIWADTENKFTVDDPAVPVWKMDEIETNLEEFWRQGKIQDDDLKKIHEVLSEVVEQSLAKK